MHQRRQPEFIRWNFTPVPTPRSSTPRKQTVDLQNKQRETDKTKKNTKKAQRTAKDCSTPPARSPGKFIQLAAQVQLIRLQVQPSRSSCPSSQVNVHPAFGMQAKETYYRLTFRQRLPRDRIPSATVRHNSQLKRNDKVKENSEKIKKQKEQSYTNVKSHPPPITKQTGLLQGIEPARFAVGHAEPPLQYSCLAEWPRPSSSWQPE
jgi:hypothetical protein